MRIYCFLTVALTAAGLSACQADAERQAAEELVISRKLPQGCEFKDLGYYDGRPVYAVTCQGCATSAISYEYKSGKTTVNPVVLQVQP